MARETKMLELSIEEVDLILALRKHGEEHSRIREEISNAIDHCDEIKEKLQHDEMYWENTTSELIKADHIVDQLHKQEDVNDDLCRWAIWNFFHRQGMYLVHWGERNSRLPICKDHH